jgi:branched-chain amino acid transport system permease protein
LRERMTSLGGWSPPLIALLVVIVYRLIAPSDYQMTLATTIGVTAIAAIGLTVAIGGAGQLALGQAGFMAVGAYVTAVLTARDHVTFLIALFVSVIVAGAGGAAVGWIAIRLKGNYLAMATLAVGAAIYALINQIQALGASNGFIGIPAPGVGPWAIVTPRQQYLLVGVTLVVVCAVCTIVGMTRPGRELRALRDDSVAAELVGINVIVRRVQIFALCSAVGGAAGSLAAVVQSVIDPAQFAPQASITLFIVVALGGMGSITGALVGAAVVEYITQRITGAGEYALAVTGAVVILLMAVVPGGLATLPGRLWSLAGHRPRHADPTSRTEGPREPPSEATPVST